MSEACILDITRLFSRRFHKVDTGIDRVERGIFEVLNTADHHAFLIRSGRHYFLLKADKAKRLLANPKRGKAMGFLQLRFAAFRRGKETIDLSGYQKFFHLGHIRHGEPFWQAVKSASLFTTILIHDVIPLDFPETCRKDQLQGFRTNFALWVRYADQIITPSQYSHDRVKAHARPRCPMRVEPLALRPLDPIKGKKEPNSFLVVGTIEPRKNHMTLLLAWQDLHRRLGEDCPTLWIIGARGWNNQETFSWLDRSGLMGKKVFELGTLSDADMQDYFSRATAIVFPSIAEGFGLPFFEAIRSGQDVLASNIPAFREAIDAKSASHLIPPMAMQEWSNRIENFKPKNYKLTINLPVTWHDYYQNINTLVTS